MIDKQIESKNEIIEQWKICNKYYSVSNTGLIKSLPRKHYLKNNNYYITKEKLKSQRINANGYYVTDLFFNDKHKKTYRVHRLVAEAFIPNPDNKPFINHKNGIKTDNRVENLEWCTPKENSEHSVLNNWHYNGERCHQSKLTENDVIKIKKLISKNVMSKEIARIFNVLETTVCEIKMGRNWKHINID